MYWRVFISLVYFDFNNSFVYIDGRIVLSSGRSAVCDYFLFHAFDPDGFLLCFDVLLTRDNDKHIKN